MGRPSTSPAIAALNDSDLEIHATWAGPIGREDQDAPDQGQSEEKNDPDENKESRAMTHLITGGQISSYSRGRWNPGFAPPNRRRPRGPWQAPSRPDASAPEGAALLAGEIAEGY